MSASRVKWVVIAALIAGLIGVRPVVASAGAEPGASSPEAGKNEAPKDKKAEAPKTDGPPAGGGGPPPAKVRVDAVRLEPVERWREVTGELRAVRQTTVAAEQTGRVASIRVDAGDRVDEGQQLAQQDDALAKIEVERAKATLATKIASVAEREADLDKARRNFRLISNAFSQNSATESERDDASTNVAAAEARLSEAQAAVAVARAELDQAQTQLRKMTIVAPFMGTVVRKFTETGQWLGEGSPIVEIVQIDQIDAYLDVPEIVLKRLGALAGGSKIGPSGELTPGQQIEVIVRVSALPEDQRERRSMVAGIIPSGDPLSRLFPVRVRMDNRDGLLRPGMSVVGLVPTGEREEALTVSRDAVMRSETGSFVYMNAGGVAGVAPVIVRYPFNNRLVVQSPVLRAGMEVVVEGNERLFPTQPLMILPSGGAPESGGEKPTSPAEPTAAK